MFKFTEPGCQVEGWMKAQPAKELRPNGRVLRERDCRPPRATTKIANPKRKKR